MEQLFETVLTVEVALTALAVGGIQEVCKQAFMSSITGARLASTAMFKTIMAVAPLVLGAGFGHLIIPVDGVANPWVMGMIAGLFAGTAYDTVKPAVKAMLSNAGKSNE